MTWRSFRACGCVRELPRSEKPFTDPTAVGEFYTRQSKAANAQSFPITPPSRPSIDARVYSLTIGKIDGRGWPKVRRRIAFAVIAPSARQIST